MCRQGTILRSGTASVGRCMLFFHRGGCNGSNSRPQNGSCAANNPAGIAATYSTESQCAPNKGRESAAASRRRRDVNRMRPEVTRREGRRSGHDARCEKGAGKLRAQARHSCESTRRYESHDCWFAFLARSCPGKGVMQRHRPEHRLNMNKDISNKSAL